MLHKMKFSLKQKKNGGGLIQQIENISGSKNHIENLKKDQHSWED